MKIKHCFLAALVGYAIVFVGFIVLAILVLLASLPSQVFLWMAISDVVIVPCVMGFLLGVRWPGRTIAYDEAIPACLITLLIFGVPWLIYPPSVPFYLLALPVTISEVLFGIKIGIEVRHYRLIDEFFGRWSIGEK